MDDPWLIGAFIVLCLLASAFFSGSETALSSISRLALKRLVRERSRRSSVLERLLSQPSRWLVTVLIGNNVVNVAAASLATLLVSKLIAGTPGMVLGVVTGLMTLLILLFGEIFPKRYAQDHSDAVALRVAPVIMALGSVFGPVAIVMTFLTGTILRRSHLARRAKTDSLTEKEIHDLIDISREEGILEKREEEMVHSALEFDDRSVREIMTPRTQIAAIWEKEHLETLRQVINQAGFSRIPVYRDGIDNIVGIAYAKDLLNLDTSPERLRVKDIMHPPVFVPYTARLSDVFRKLQLHKKHMAIVVGEYGGVVGLLTVEDLLEELVGDIEDEYDVAPTTAILPLQDGSFLVDGATDIDEINAHLNTELPEKGASFESIGGLIITLLGRIPERGEHVAYANLILEIVDADETRIKQVKITRTQNVESSPPN